MRQSFREVIPNQVSSTGDTNPTKTCIPSPQHNPKSPKLKLETQLHDFFVETLGHISLAFLELDYCDGGDLHELILASGQDDRDGGPRRHVLPKPTAFGGRSSGGTTTMGGGGDGQEKGSGLPAEQIARVTLGLCEGLQRLHEVRVATYVVTTLCVP